MPPDPPRNLAPSALEVPSSKRTASVICVPAVRAKRLTRKLKCRCNLQEEMNSRWHGEISKRGYYVEMTPVHFTTASSEALLLNGTTARPASGVESMVPADDDADGSATFTTRYIAGVTTSGVLAIGFILLCCHSAIKLKIWKPVDG
ncbi:hypothetical protein Bbelb_115420 [Branchiostoma belcheri]|nr:hypothetical protein Bbelb_115420 [Branchiostoma belcheri]